MSAIPVFEYIGGIFAFGFFGLIMNDVVLSSRQAYWTVVNGTAVQTLLEPTEQLAHWIWLGLFIIYLLLGGWWLINMYRDGRLSI